MPEWGKCSSCAKPFVADVSWKKQCILCWKRERGFEMAKSDVELGFALDRILELEAAMRGVQAALDARNADLDARNAERAKLSTSRLSKSRIRELITLCHPDRHGNSARANDVTRWLLLIRDEGST